MEQRLYADLVIINGNVWTLNDAQPRAECLAIFSDTILKIGNNNDIEPLIGPPTEIIDVQNNTVLPGFIDSHTHIAWTGLNKMRLDLGKTKSLSEALELIEKETAEKNAGEWIIGRNWDQSKWKEQRYITAADLDPISTKNPVILKHVSGHFDTINTYGFEKLDLSKDLKGVDLDEYGEITGTLRDVELSEYKEIQPSLVEFIQGIKLGMKEAVKLGITSVHDNITFELLPAYKELIKNNELLIRVYGIIYQDMLEETIKLDIDKNFGDKWFKIGAVKLMTDGALSSRTALMFEDYDDKPGEKGFALYDETMLSEMVTKVHKANLQLAIHAIGDKAISNVVKAIEDNLDPEECKEMMHRIEHAEILRKEEVRRSKPYGIVFSMQPNFVYRWGLVGVNGMYEKRIGLDRTLLNNPFKWILDENLLLIFGSDGMPLGPLYGIKGALFHSNPELRLSLEEAIRCFTLYPAIVSKDEKDKGTLEKGKLADITILDKNLDEIDLEKFCDVDVAYTIIGGRIIYKRE